MHEDPVTLEEYIPGSFLKYIKNNGHIHFNLSENFKNLLDKAECFAHYTYESKERKMMVVGLQEVAYNLFDPEIATVGLLSDGEMCWEFIFRGNSEISVRP